MGREPPEILMTRQKPQRKTASRAIKRNASARTSASRTIVCKVARTKQTSRPKRDQVSATKATGRASSKQAQILAMLRVPVGTTIDAMMRVSGWQQHSVRGFLAGVVRKKLGLDLVSEAGESGRVYRIRNVASKTAASAKTAQAA